MGFVVADRFAVMLFYSGYLDGGSYFKDSLKIQAVKKILKVA